MKKQTEVNHPLVKAGLISDDLAEILLVPDFVIKSSGAPNGENKRELVFLPRMKLKKEIEEKENIKKEKEEKLKQRKLQLIERKEALVMKKGKKGKERKSARK